MERKQVLFLVHRRPLNSFIIGKRILALQLFIETDWPEIELTNRVLLDLTVLLLSQLTLMLNIIQTLLVRECLKVTQLPNLLHLLLVSPHLPLLSLLRLRFVPLEGLQINIVLHFLQPLVQDSPMFKRSRHLFPEICEIRCIKSPMNNIFLLTMIPKISRGKLLMLYITMLMRWHEIYLRERSLSLLPLRSLRCHVHTSPLTPFITNENYMALSIMG